MSNETLTLTVSRINAVILSLALNEFNLKYEGKGMFGPDSDQEHRDLYWYLVNAFSQDDAQA